LVDDIDPSNQWLPNYPLPFKRSNHPLDQSCSINDLEHLTRIASLQPTSIVATLHSSPLENLTTLELRHLLSHNSPINQQSINLYTQLLCHQFPVKCLDSSFFSSLQHDGWNSVSRWFHHPQSTCRRRSSTPSVTGESAVAIPCHVNNNHWVAVTRRELHGEVIFLYADDLNQASTEAQVQSTLSSSNIEFYPTTAKWINCKNFTYLPHSNECGIRTLLALTIQSIHPHPADHILLPLMDQNLAQIGRAWIALCLLNRHIPEETILWVIDQPPQQYPVDSQQQSNPASIIPWPSLSQLTNSGTTRMTVPDSGITCSVVRPRKSLGSPAHKLATANFSAPTAVLKG